MDLNEASNELMNRIEAYWRKVEEGVRYCKLHDTQYIDEQECVACEREKAEFAQELQDRSAAALE